jgi:uncharacterized protein YggE
MAVVTNVLGQIKNFIDQPYIEVTGYADTLIIPDQIFIKIIVSEKDSKDKISLEELENKMIAAFKTMGIRTETDLSTSDMLSNHKSYLLKQKDIFKSKEFILKVADAQAASNVFLQLEDIGIANTSIDRVDHTDLENITNVCRTRAVKNAKAKAIAVTAPLRQHVGNAIHIADAEIDRANALQGRVGGVVITGNNSDWSEQQKYDASKIEFKKMKVQSAIGVKFMLK